MNKPQMILFDYGQTLLYEPDFDTLRGYDALEEYTSNNPQHCSTEEINKHSQRIFEGLAKARAIGIEVSAVQNLRLVYESLGIELAIPYQEAEDIFWNATSHGQTMPHVEKMIEYINEQGLRSGVVSNISVSAETLKKRIDRLLPQNRFEFIIASSDYGIRKPDKALFELALCKAMLPAEDIWFCGDNVICDVEGSSAAGMYPVWYEDLTIPIAPWAQTFYEPECKHLHINSWQELIVELKKVW